MKNIHITNTIATFEVGRGKECLKCIYTTEGVFTYTSVHDANDIDISKLVNTEKVKEYERLITNELNYAFKYKSRTVWGYDASSWANINYFYNNSHTKLYRRIKYYSTKNRIGVSYITSKGNCKILSKKVSNLLEWLPSLNEKVIVEGVTGVISGKALGDNYWVYLDNHEEVLTHLLKIHPIKGLLND